MDVSVRLLLLLLLAGVGAALTAGCVAPPASVAVIDLDAVARALGRDDVINAQVTEVNRSLRAQLLERSEEMRAQLQTQRDALGDEAGEDALEDFQQALRSANDQFDRIQRSAVARSRQVRDALVVGFRQEVAQVARDVARGRGVRAVLSSDASLLWYEPSLDLTDEVIAEMRARGRGAAGAPVPAPGDAGEQGDPAASPAEGGRR